MFSNCGADSHFCRGTMKTCGANGFCRRRSAILHSRLKVPAGSAGHSSDVHPAGSILGLQVSGA